MLALLISAWIKLAILALFALFFFVLLVIFPLLIFAAALIERQRIETLISTQENVSEKTRQKIAEATALGFSLVGVFDDEDRGKIKGKVALLLSADHNALLRITQAKLQNPYRFVSQLPGEISLVTSPSSGITDMSGAVRHEMLPGVPMAVLWHYHWQRLAVAGELVPFPSEGLPQLIAAQQKARYELMCQAGLMRKIRGPSDAYRFTPRGAWRLFLLYFDALKKARDLNDLAKIKQAEFELYQRSMIRPG